MEDGNENNKPWQIEAVVIGDGSKGAGANGKTLKSGCVYASAKMRGGHENYHAIDPATITMSLRGEVGFSFFTKALDTSRCGYQKVCQITAETLDFDVEREWDENLVDEILCWCMMNKGIAVLFGGPGALGSETSVARWYCDNGVKILARSSQLSCAPAALVNAVNCLVGTETALAVLATLNKIDNRCTKMGQLGPVVHKLGERLTIVRLPRDEKKTMPRDGFKRVSRQVRGVWLVRLCNPPTTDHCVSVDAGRGLILDSGEESSVTLSEESLRMCAGSTSARAHVAEVYELRQR